MLGLLGLSLAFISHATGNATRLALGLAQGELTALLLGLYPLSAFFVGSTAAGMVIGHEKFQPSRRYGVLMIGESILLFFAVLLFSGGFLLGGEIFAALACGLQNGMANRIGEYIVRTTHVTGILTDLGIKLGSAIRGLPIQKERAALHGGILLGFIFGGGAMAAAFPRFGFSAGFFPAAFMLLMGASFLWLRLRHPQLLARHLSDGRSPLDEGATN